MITLIETKADSDAACYQGKVPTSKLYLSGLTGKSNYNLQMHHIDLIINATNEVQLSEYKAKKGNKLFEIRIPVDDNPEGRLSVYFMVSIFHKS